MILELIIMYQCQGLIYIPKNTYDPDLYLQEMSQSTIPDSLEDNVAGTRKLTRNTRDRRVYYRHTPPKASTLTPHSPTVQQLPNLPSFSDVPTYTTVPSGWFERMNEGQ